MLVSFTQTYGNNRNKLYEIYSKDNRLIEFKNMFDKNIHSFHNCDSSTIDYFKSINPIQNTEYLEFGDVDYTDTILYLQNYLNQIGCTHFLWTQDDSFSAENDNLDFNELIQFINTYDDNLMISLANSTEFIKYTEIGYVNGNWETLNPNPFKNPSIVHQFSNDYVLYEANTTDYRKVGIWSLDDTPYICTIDIFNNLYNQDYIDAKNVWDAEIVLGERFEQELIPRYLFNKKIFMNYNIIGQTIHSKDFYEETLIQKGLY